MASGNPTRGSITVIVVVNPTRESITVIVVVFIYTVETISLVNSM